jgi:ribonuclease Z
MIELIVLGTSCMQPTKDRNHPGILLKYKNENILFECGENIQRQLRKAGLKTAKITKIFLSHWHGDHTLGLPGLMFSMAADQTSNKIQIYGPKGTKEKIHYLTKIFPSNHFIEHEIIELNPKKCDKINFQDFTIEVCQLEHKIPCLGYSFIEKDMRKIKPKYVKKIPGPLLGKLQKSITITHQKKKITPEEATYLIKGKKISFIMDTRPCDNFLKLAENSDILFSESTFLDQHKEKAEKYYHMTAKEAGLLANQANVKKLILLHFSPRYKDVGAIRDEAKEVFKDVVCAEDFMRFKL